MTSPYDDTTEINERAADRAREVQMEHYLSETDRAAVEQLSERYKEMVPPERIETVRQQDTVFMGDRELFDAVCEHETGKSPEPGEQVLGYSLGASESPRIATDYLEVPRVIYHERLHQLSTPGIETELGRRLDEGITEDLAIENLGAEPLEGDWGTYPVERRTAHELRTLCGDAAVESAYFQGDTQALRACLDRELGPNGLEQLREGLGDSIEEPESRR